MNEPKEVAIPLHVLKTITEALRIMTAAQLARQVYADYEEQVRRRERAAAQKEKEEFIEKYNKLLNKLHKSSYSTEAPIVYPVVDEDSSETLANYHAYIATKYGTDSDDV